MDIKTNLAIFKNKIFTYLFLASFTSQLGSVVGIVAFTFYLLEEFGHSPMLATITEMMYSLPTLAVFFIVGVVADRMDRQRVAVYSDWICAALTLVLLVAIWIGFLPLVFTILFLRSAVSKFFQPAEAALVQGILSKEQLTTAAGLNQMLGSIFMLFGSGIGALCYWHIGVMGAITVDAFSFILSGILIHKCLINQEVRLPNGYTNWKDIKLILVINDLKLGINYIYGHKLLLSLLLGLIILGFVNGGLTVMPIFMMKYKLAPNNYEQMAVLQSIIIGTAILVGSPFVSIFVNKIKLHKLIIVGFLVGFVSTVCQGLSWNVTSYLMYLFIFALSIPLVNIPFNGWISQIVDPQMMGRVQGWIGPLFMVSQSIMLGFISISFPKYLSVEALFYLVGAFLLVVVLYYMFILPGLASKETKSLINQQAIR